MSLILLHFEEEKKNKQIISFKRLKQCPSGSLIRLNLNDLLKRLHVFRESIDEARKVFNAKYEQSLFLFDGHGPFDGNHQNHIAEQHGLVHLTNLKVIKSLFSHFGDLVRRIQVSFDAIDENDANDIMNHINKNCFKTLEMLHLENCKENHLLELKNEFTNVRTLILLCSSNDEHISGDFKMNKIFSNLYELHLKHMTTNDWTIIEDKWPKLRKLSVQLSKAKEQNELQTSKLLNFIRINSQIDDLMIQHSSWRFLKKIIEILPQLKSLSLINLSTNSVNYEGEPIDFKAVKYLFIESEYKHEIPTKMTFNQLDRLGLKFQYELTDDWLKLMTQQISPGVKHLDIEVDGLSLEQFLAVPGKLHVLESVNISCGSTFKPNDIVLFVKKSPRLNNLVLNIRLDSMDQDRLKQLLQNKWRITYRPGPDQSLIVTMECKRFGYAFILLLFIE